METLPELTQSSALLQGHREQLSPRDLSKASVSSHPTQGWGNPQPFLDMRLAASTDLPQPDAARTENLKL